jgi:hypothetical protein
VSLFIGFSLHDQAVAFEAIERAVDLPDVQRPRRPGATVELGTQLIAVAGALVENREQALPHRHVVSVLRGSPHICTQYMNT